MSNIDTQEDLPEGAFDAICDEIEEFLFTTEELTEEIDFRSTVRIILSYGVRPTSSLLGWLGLVNGRDLSKRQSKWRTEELIKAGWQKRGKRGRWYKISDEKLYGAVAN